MSERRWGILVGLLIAAFIGGTVWMQVRRTTRSPYDARPSTYNPSPPGLMAFYNYLDESGYHVERWLRPLAELGEAMHPPAILVLATPSHRTVSEEDAKALLQWVKHGGVLIYLVDFELLPGSQAEKLHLLLRLPVERHRPSYFRISSEPVTDASPTLPYPLVEGVHDLSVQNSADLLPAARNAVTLFSDAAGPALLWRPLGEGEIFVARSAASLSNQAILSGDNLRFWLRVLHGVPGAGPVAFVEYYLGYSKRASQSAWSRRDVRLALLQTLLVSIVLILAMGKRFGGRVRILDQSRRSSLEYVDSMAQLFRRAGAEEHVRAETLRRFLAAATRALGLPRGAPVAEISHRLSELTGRPQDDIDALLVHHDALETLPWARALARLETETHERTARAHA